jgi:hypothetical protein
MRSRLDHEFGDDLGSGVGVGKGRQGLSWVGLNGGPSSSVVVCVRAKNEQKRHAGSCRAVAPTSMDIQLYCYDWFYFHFTLTAELEEWKSQNRPTRPSQAITPLAGALENILPAWERFRYRYIHM